MTASTRVACVRVYDLEMQVALRDRPTWSALPVALVREDRHDAPLVALNAHARRAGLAEGVRHNAARSLVPALRTTAVPAGRVREALDEVAEALRAFSPRVEPDGAGAFLVDPTGMGRLHRGARAWALAVRRAVTGRGLACAVVVGFDRRTTRAVASHVRGVAVARSIHEERALAGEVPLAALGLDARALRDLAALGVRTLGHLWSLPFEAVRPRFGDAVAALRRWADDDEAVPVQPDTPPEPARTVIEVDPPDDDQARLLFAVRGALHLLVARLASQGEAAAVVRLALDLEDRGRVEHRLEPASPTRDVALLVELARLRLSEASLTARVREVELTVEGAAVRGEQLFLFAHDRARDRRAAGRAIARVRAAFGEASVTRARLRDAHLPEAGFAWEPVGEAPPQAPAAPRDEATATPLVRRLVMPPREVTPDALCALSPAPPGASLAWVRSTPANDTAPDATPLPSEAWAGVAPSRVSGAWWARPVERDYYYAEGRDGRLLWVFYDRVRARWFVHGIVD